MQQYASKAAFEFTTLATVYEISKSVLEAEIGHKLNTKVFSGSG